VRGEADTLAFLLGLVLVIVGVGLFSVPLAIILAGLCIIGAAAFSAYLKAVTRRAGKRDQ
jgi:hypothetical protein